MKNGPKKKELGWAGWQYVFNDFAGACMLDRIRIRDWTPLEEWEARSPVGSSPIDPVDRSVFGMGDVAAVYIASTSCWGDERQLVGTGNTFASDYDYRIAGRLRDGRLFYICKPIDVRDVFIPEHMRDMEGLAVVASNWPIFMSMLPPAVRGSVTRGMRKAEKLGKRKQLEGRS